MTLQKLLEEATEKLERAGVPDAPLDARYLLLAAFDLNLAGFLGKRFDEVERLENAKEAKERFLQWTVRRASRVPLQHILGEQDFMGLSFCVNEHVLVPRQDTETLVELILEEQKDRDISLIDLCTGSGCIAISLAKLGKYSKVTALDISDEALCVAEENARRILGEENEAFSLIKSDMFVAIPPEERFDVIVSNPPYIPSEVIEGLSPEVRDHEPRLALDGSEDGLKFYRILAEQGYGFLREGGALYLEIGYDQGESVPKLLENAGFSKIKVIKDMAGLNRVVRAERR